MCITTFCSSPPTHRPTRLLNVELCWSTSRTGFLWLYFHPMPSSCSVVILYIYFCICMCIFVTPELRELASHIAPPLSLPHPLQVGLCGHGTNYDLPTNTNVAVSTFFWGMFEMFESQHSYFHPVLKYDNVSVSLWILTTSLRTFIFF